MIKKEIIMAYALKNAIEHSGKAVAGSVISGLFNHGLTKDKIKDIIGDVHNVLDEINSMGADEQKNEYEKLEHIIGHRPEREGLPELEGVDKKKGVVMRFSPSPSGPMHLGHILTGMLNSLYVKKYSGKFYLQIEDTNADNIDVLSYKSIPKDADWIFGNVTKVIIQSDRIKIYYKYLEKLFKKNAIYVCTCDVDKFKELIDNKKACPCRKLSKKENLLRWKKMLDSRGYKEGEAVIRFKSDIHDSNPAFRDFPLARINLTKHPRQEKKYRVWPLMNLCVAVDDIELKKTHIIRAKEHRDNATRQKMIYESLGLSRIYPKTYFLGRWNFTDMAISDSKTKKAIAEGKFTGWDDIRIPFVLPFRKRGYQPEAFAKLIEQRGISEVDKVISKKDFFQVLNNFNREILRNKTRKASFVRCNEKNANLVVLMPSAEKVFGKSEIKPKKEEIIYFDRFGYAKNNGFEGKGKLKKKLFWFGHE